MRRRDFLKRLGGGLAAGVLPAGPLLAGACAPAARAAGEGLGPGGLDALLVVLSDTHSAYGRYPRLLAAVDALRARHPGVPTAFLFNGDLFERGNVVALRGDGRADLAMAAALAARAPLVFNVGNHEGALFPLPDALARVDALGARVVSNIVDAGTGRPLAPPAVTLELGGARLAAMGVATSHMATYRPEVREGIRVPHGPAYAAEHLPRLLGDAPLRVVLSHEGTLDDRALLPHLPDGTLVVGGHDHLRFTHREGRTLYLHTGSWGEWVTVVGARLRPGGVEWSWEQLPVPADGAADADLAALVRAEEAAHLTAAERAVVGRAPRAMELEEASRFAAAALRDAAGAEVALIANTTFGTGLPAGPVTRHRFDAFLRFDNALVRAPVDGAVLAAILARANQFGGTPFDRRTGEFVVATPLERIDPARRYTLATDGWVRLNAERYLGVVPAFEEIPELRLKAVVAAALAG